MESWDRKKVQAGTARLLRDLISERIGIHFDENNLDIMSDKISPLMAERGIDSMIDYYYLLKYGPDEGDSENEWANLINTLSVRETFFWREVDQIRAFVDVLVPQLSNMLDEPLTIWCAASASGEEPLTIAMALDDAGWFQRLPIRITASDASPTAIATAEAGIYRERSFRNLPLELKSRYFTETRGGWKISPDIHRRIEWRRANLVHPPDIQDLAASRVIFCRNVFIYFTESTIRKIAQYFQRSMPEPGYLFLGAAESLLKFNTRFKLADIGSAFVYVKQAGDS